MARCSSRKISRKGYTIKKGSRKGSRVSATCVRKTLRKSSSTRKASRKILVRKSSARKSSARKSSARKSSARKSSRMSCKSDQVWRRAFTNKKGTRVSGRCKKASQPTDYMHRRRWSQVMNLAASSSNPALINIALDAFVTAAEADPLGTAFIVKNRKAIEKLARNITSSLSIRSPAIKQVIPSTDYSIKTSPRKSEKKEARSSLTPTKKVFVPTDNLKPSEEQNQLLEELKENIEDNIRDIKRVKYFISKGIDVDVNEEFLKEYESKAILLNAKEQTLLNKTLSVPQFFPKTRAYSNASENSTLTPKDVSNIVAALNDPAVLTDVKTDTVAATALISAVGNNPDLLKSVSQNKKALHTLVVALEDPAILQTAKENPKVAAALLTLADSPIIVETVLIDKKASATLSKVISSPIIIASAKKFIIPPAPPIELPKASAIPLAPPTAFLAGKDLKKVVSQLPAANPAAAFLAQIGNFKFNPKKLDAIPTEKPLAAKSLLSQIREKKKEDLKKLSAKPAAKPVEEPVVCAINDIKCFLAKKYAAIHGDDWE